MYRLMMRYTGVKLRYDKEHRNNLKKAASEATAETENLIGSLNYAIKAWRKKNLE